MDNPWTTTQRLKLFWRKLKLKIPRNSLVLEVGSGGAPHFRSDILCDKYLSGKGTARVGELRTDRPFVFADAEALPFVDKAFDYIICFHVLEHLDNPEKCLNEMMRVGRAGYIETPCEVTEKIQGWTCHKWFVRLENQKLILTQKSNAVFDPLLHITFHSLAHKKNRAYLEFISANRDLFTVAYEWQDNIDYEFIPTQNPVQRIGFEEPELDFFAALDPHEVDIQNNGHFQFDDFIKTYINRVLRSMHAKKDLNLFDLLACPICKKKLSTRQDKLICRHCRKLYPTKNGLPVLLQEMAQPLLEPVTGENYQ